MRRHLIPPILALLTLATPALSMTQEERREYRDKRLKILPEVPSFAQWLDASGELPPDFDALARINGLPDPLRFLDGKPVRTGGDWTTRRVALQVGCCCG